MNAILPNEFSQTTWVKVFKNGPSRICGRQSLKIWSDMHQENFVEDRL